MIEAATVVATESGQVMREVIVAAAREAEAQELPEGGDGTRLGVGADIVIPASNFKGDVFYSPVSTLGVTHGHSGIFSTLQTIVEAPGPGKQVRNTNRSNVKVASGSHQQVVNTTQAKRDKAVTKALTFVGRAYNLNFAFNKTANGAMNCSQVVWVAYKDGSGIDLDANGGNGVYPIDIKNSSHTSTYRIVK
ncbi:MAG: hypothetical protein LBH13_04175 [Cellulomonadaceae bacterium]|nr:hypothetical protein [Cellulomonadaceae bacterium]